MRRTSSEKRRSGGTADQPYGPMSLSFILSHSSRLFMVPRHLYAYEEVEFLSEKLSGYFMIFTVIIVLSQFLIIYYYAIRMQPTVNKDNTSNTILKATSGKVER